MTGSLRHISQSSATNAGTTAGAIVAATVLLALAIALSREPGNPLKSLVAVWLIALPVLGVGALCGRLLALAFVAVAKGRRTEGRRS